MSATDMSWKEQAGLGPMADLATRKRETLLVEIAASALFVAFGVLKLLSSEPDSLVGGLLYLTLGVGWLVPRFARETKTWRVAHFVGITLTRTGRCDNVFGMAAAIMMLKSDPGHQELTCLARNLRVDKKIRVPFSAF